MIAGIAILLLDQITKTFFGTRDFFVGSIHFHQAKNYGLPFGLNFNPGINAVVIGIAVFIIYYFCFKKKQENYIGLVLVGSGAFSNVLDRISLGYVRDFIDLGMGFTFNFADVAIIIGLFFLSFCKQLLRDKEQKNKHN
ncbi:MAG: signal peptidase II [Candidatus Doudnabacteria bacterium]|nr:signal peptidase II [Candidatus Doudnabacteria bacterium]